MPCLNNYTLAGIGFDCSANLAGVKDLYLTYYKDVIPSIDYTTHTVSAYTLEDGAEWYKYSFERGAAYLNSVLTNDEETGSRYYTNTISVGFNKLQNANHLELMTVAAERLAAVVVDNNNKKWYLNVDGAVGGTSLEAGTGGERNGYTLEIAGESKYLPFRFTAPIDEPTPVKVFGFTPDGYSPSSAAGTFNTTFYNTGYEFLEWFALSGNWYTATTNGNRLAITYTENTGTFRQAMIGALGRDLDTDEPVYAYFILSQSPGGTPVKYVQDLLDEGFARVVPGPHGNYIEILETNPYSAAQILDLWEVAFNEKQLSADTANAIVWNQPPSAIDPADIRAAYDGQDMNFTPRGELFWQDMGDSASTDVFEVSFNGAEWIAADYPWGSYNSEGIFAPRYNADMESYYAEQGFRNTPMKVKVNFNNFSSVGQVLFTEMRTTKELTINIIEGQYFGCHDVVGMFEADDALETLNITGDFIWQSIRTCLNMFDGCMKLTAIPYNTRFARSHPYNELFPRFDGTRGTANVRRILNNCSALTSFGPIFNMSAISRSGATWDGYSQDPTTETIFNCPNLTDICIKGLGHNSWNFADSSTGTYLPKISASSIDYLLQNVQTVSGLTLALPSLNRSQVTSGYIELAQGRGWTIVWA